MTHIMIVAMTLLLSFILAYASSSTEGSKLLELEKQRYHAMVKKDLEHLDSILDKDLIFTHASATVDTKESFMSNLGSGILNYKAIDLEDLEVRMHGACGIVTGKSYLDIHVRGEDRRLKLQFTTVWVENQGEWKVVAYQSTRAED